MINLALTENRRGPDPQPSLAAESGDNLLLIAPDPIAETHVAHRTRQATSSLDWVFALVVQIVARIQTGPDLGPVHQLDDPFLVPAGTNEGAVIQQRQLHIAIPGQLGQFLDLLDERSQRLGER